MPIKAEFGVTLELIRRVEDMPAGNKARTAITLCSEWNGIRVEWATSGAAQHLEDFTE